MASKKSGAGAGASSGASVSAAWDKALEKARESNKLLVVDFYADWCPPCKQMAATTLQNAQVTDWLAKNAIFLKANVDHERTLASAHGVRTIPTVAAFAPSGKEMDRFVGFRGPAEFLAFAEAALKASQGGGAKANKNGGLF
jgi:thiol:disulfide interchange protein